MPSPRQDAEQRAEDVRALCSHHISSCGVAAACTPCVAAALTAERRRALEEAVMWANAAIEHMARVGYERMFEERWLSLHPGSIERALWHEIAKAMLAEARRWHKESSNG